MGIGDNLKYYTLDDVFTRVKQLVDRKFISDNCPQFESTNKFKIKLRRKEDVKKGEIKYYTLRQMVPPRAKYEFGKQSDEVGVGDQKQGKRRQYTNAEIFGIAVIVLATVGICIYAVKKVINKR